MEFANHFEYTVEAKNEGKLKRNRILLVLGYILFVSVFMTVVFITKIIPVGALVITLTSIIVFFTWRYVQIEYEYVINSGDITFTILYGRKTKKEMLTTKIRDMALVAPYRGEHKAKADSVADKKLAVSAMSSPDVYFAIYTDSVTNKEAVIFFEATSKALDLFEFYNRAATVKAQTRY